MDFREQQAIYLQIAAYACEQILLKKWPPGAKVISIRDLAVSMEVNPNTVQRAYDFLQQLGIITNKRGVGYFVELDAADKVIIYRREKFIGQELPVLFRNMYLLGMPITDLENRYQQFIKENFNTYKP